MPERDPIKALRAFPTEGTAMDPLAPSEVRRRGDALRRRRTMAAAGGAVAAVLIIAGGGFALANLSGGDDDSSPGPAASSSSQGSQTPSDAPKSSDPAAPYTESPTDLPTDIPQEIDLQQDWPEAGPRAAVRIDGPSSSNPEISLRVCGPMPKGLPAAASRVTVYRSQDKDQRARELRVFADIKAARTYFRGIRKTYAGCLKGKVAGRETVTEVRDLDKGDEAFDVASVLQAGDGEAGYAEDRVHLLKVLRIGNAVLIDQGSRPGETTGDIVTEHGRQLVTLVEEMCVYDPIGCDGNG